MSVLVVVALHVFHRYDFRRKFGINLEKFVLFVEHVDMLYHDNPYHCALHASDVLQTIHAFLQTSGLVAMLSQLEVLAILVAAVVHDVDHPGVNNPYLVATKDDLAYEFNDQSVLENHHTRVCFQLLRRNDLNFLENLSDSEFRQFRDVVIVLILGTDNKHHFQALGSLKARLEQVTSVYDMLSNEDDKKLLLKTLLHAADISNSVKRQPVCVFWAKRVMAEFALQGAKEKEHGLPITRFCDPDADILACQRGFIQFFVQPLFDLLAAHLKGFDILSDQLQRNLSFWHGESTLRDM
jgi:cAMP-specific phosphodiesterase 4